MSCYRICGAQKADWVPRLWKTYCWFLCMFRWFVKVWNGRLRKIESFQFWKAGLQSYIQTIQFASSEVLPALNNALEFYLNITMLEFIYRAVCSLFIVGLKPLQNHYYRYYTMLLSMINIIKLEEYIMHSNVYIGVVACCVARCLSYVAKEVEHWIAAKVYINLCFTCARTPRRKFAAIHFRFGYSNRD